MAPRNKILKVNEPEDIEPKKVTLDPIPNAEVLTIGQSEYEEVGVCAVCGTKVYRCNKGHDHAGIGNQLAVYVAFSSKEPPGLYCQKDDPNLPHRLSVVHAPVAGTIPGDIWRPRS